MDLLLPVLILGTSAIWYEILARSGSTLIPNYFYASLIFIVLANLSVQVHFLPSLLVSLLITGYALWNAYRLNRGGAMVSAVFVLVYLPVVLFSLFNSWKGWPTRTV